jgi:hypothetical protein
MSKTPANVSADGTVPSPSSREGEEAGAGSADREVGAEREGRGGDVADRAPRALGTRSAGGLGRLLKRSAPLW